jgi:poly(beta-D-mannuronate) lyase
MARNNHREQRWLGTQDFRTMLNRRDLFGHILKRLTALCLMLGSMPAIAHADAFFSPYASAPGFRRNVRPIEACPPTPAAIVNLTAQSGYVPGKWNEPVPELVAAFEAATRPLHGYLSRLVSFANISSQLSGPARTATRDCAIRWMTDWAQQGALLGELSVPVGQYERRSAVEVLSEVYLQLYAGEREPPLPPEPVARWLHAMADHLKDEYRENASEKNNHFYYAGLTALAAGTVLKDRALYAWGVHRIEAGLKDVTPAGDLPLELKRGGVALYYHAFSARVLVQAAMFMQANGGRPFEINNGALTRLVHNVLAGLADPGVFEKKTGQKQRPMNKAAQNTQGWLEIYYSLTKDPQAEPWIRSMRPFIAVWLGGNVSNLFGRDLPAGPSASSPLFEQSAPAKGG